MHRHFVVKRKSAAVSVHKMTEATCHCNISVTIQDFAEDTCALAYPFTCSGECQLACYRSLSFGDGAPRGNLYEASNQIEEKGEKYGRLGVQPKMNALILLVSHKSPPLITNNAEARINNACLMRTASTILGRSMFIVAREKAEK